MRPIPNPPMTSTWSSNLVKYDLFAVLDAPPHGIPSGLGVVALDGSQNPAVAGKRLLRASLHLQRPFPRIAQQIHEDVEDLQHDAIIGSQSNAIVEFGVLGNC